jgi:hypothetical protein
VDRVLKGTPASISNSWYSDGALADPGVTTIGIVAADGTVVVASGTATTGAGAAARSFALTTTHTAELEHLTVTWTTANFGTATTYVEVVGGYLFSLSDLDAKLQTPADYTAAEKTAARTRAESALERACGVAFVPRYERETRDGSGLYRLAVSWPNVRSVRTVLVSGTSVTVADITGRPGGTLYNPTGWTSGYDNIVVEYEHGYDYPPPEVAEACAILAKHYLVQGPIDDRAISQTSEFGVVTLSTPGVRGVRFGLPEVDAVVSQYAVGLVVV